MPAFGRASAPACFFGVLVVAGVAHLIKTPRWSRDRLGALCFSAYMIVPLSLFGDFFGFDQPELSCGRVDQMVFPAFCVIAALGICAVPSLEFEMANGRHHANFVSSDVATISTAAILPGARGRSATSSVRAFNPGIPLFAPV